MNKHYNYTQSNDDLPEIVEEKCQEAYAQIRLKAASGKKHSHWSIRKKAAAIVSVAAAAALGITFAAPAVASSEIMQNIYAFFSSEAVYSKDPATKNNLSSYAQLVQTEKDGSNGTLHVESVYFDGDNISMTLRLTDLPENMLESTCLSAPIEATLGGQELKFRDITGEFAVDSETGVIASMSEEAEGKTTYTTMSLAGFVKSDNGYCTVLTATYDGEIKDTLPLQLSIPYYRGSNSSIQILASETEDGNRCYEPKDIGICQSNLSLETTVQYQSGLKTTYDVQETKNGITLERIIVSPFSTEIAISGDFGEYDTVYITDQNQNSYQPIFDTDNPLSFNGISTWEAPLTDATSISITIVPDKGEIEDGGTCFTVPIEKGYRSPAVNSFETADGNDITYIPPLDE
ncbi:hypothetical protein [uncultured Ruminococcus sp.]|uniref:hypothetical protein n=1 Tax=uncultured Ruminococcus sp. TaxID=165186 RepID=UPI00262F2EF9|nr:hypothetical protein [uncultured Ruminococcus sp.]